MTDIINFPTPPQTHTVGIPPMQTDHWSRANFAGFTQETGVVSSHNDWDPLREVIVGRMDGSCIPVWQDHFRATLPKRYWSLFREQGGKPFPAREIDAANANLDALAELLSQLGVTVRRPESVDHAKAIETPHWQQPSGFYTAMPRDIAMVVGDTIIEAAMSWRCRAQEIDAYRPLFLEYFTKGAKWVCPPKPLLKDSLYHDDFGQEPGGEFRSVLTETEIVFDAADFLVCGRDVLCFMSHTLNSLGVDWLSRALGDDYRLTVLDCQDGSRMHIDTTFLPIAPGKVLVNPDRVHEKPAIFRNWDMLPCPPPCTPDSTPLYMSGKWLSMNILMVDETTAIVAAHEESLQRSLKEWGIDAIPCPFIDFYRFGGSIHCATLDIRREGELLSYF